MTHKRASTVVCAIAMFMTVMDSQIVNVALATITHDLHTVTSSAQWVITSYTLSLAVFTPASGWVGDRFGPKRVFLLAITLFTITSGLCAVAPTVLTLIVMRVLQGAAGGMLLPVGIAMMNRAHPASERVGAVRTMTMIMIMAPATAPLIGGALVTELSWRWIFLVNVPVGVGLLLFTLAFVEEYHHERRGRYDPAGLLLGGPGLGLLLYAISDGPIDGWGSARVLIAAVLGIVLLSWFVRVELTRRNPLLDLRLLGASELFRRSCALQMCQTMAFFGCLVFTNLYVQEARGYSALTSGTTTFPEAIAIGIASPLVARLYTQFGPRRLLASGFALLTVGSCLLARMGDHTSLWVTRAWTFELGCGSALVLLSVQAAAYSQISARETGHASAIYNTLQRSSQATTVALLATVLAISAGTSLHPSAADFHPVFFTTAAVSVLGILIALGVRDADAAGTMAPRPAPTGEELQPA